MCKHEEIVTASRNAVVGVWAGLDLKYKASLEMREEFSRRENAYDAILESLEQGCESCKADRNNIFRKSDFLRWVDEYVEHYKHTCKECELVDPELWGPRPFVL